MEARIKRLHIAKKLECLVFDKAINDRGLIRGLQSGARIFCGHCGESIGETENSIIAPFADVEFIQNLLYKQCGIMNNMFVCHMCNARMFPPRNIHTFFGTATVRGTWHFVELVEFMMEQQPFREQLKSVLNIKFDQDEIDQLNQE